MKKNDFLRQVISYEYPNYAWERDHFSLREQFKDLVREVLDEIKEKKNLNKNIKATLWRPTRTASYTERPALAVSLLHPFTRIASL